MSPEFETYLKNSFKNLYYKLINFECDDGWFELIKKLSSELSLYYPEVFIDEIKEKFGRLTIHWGVDNEIYDEKKLKFVEKLIVNYENLSYFICEICGDTGKLFIQNKWLKKVLCECCLLKQ